MLTHMQQVKLYNSSSCTIGHGVDFEVFFYSPNRHTVMKNTEVENTEKMPDKAGQLEQLQTAANLMQNEIKALNQKLAEKEFELDAKQAELLRSTKSSVAMKNLLSQQKKLGDQCKLEMETLTRTFEEKSRNYKCNNEDLRGENVDLKEENQKLREEISRLRADLEDKTVEAYEAKEMNGIYSAKLTKLERKFKKYRDEDEESYMEMTF